MNLYRVTQIEFVDRFSLISTIVFQDFIGILKCLYDENRIFSIEAILKHKQVACMKKKCCLLFSNISFCFRDIEVFKICKHREHTILLSRERVNKGTKIMNSLPLSPLIISSYLARFYWENRCLKIMCNTVALNSYLGLSALSKNFFFICIKFNKGGNSLPKHSELTDNIRSNL